MATEHSIQNQIRNALINQGSFFRANVGQAWTGNKTKRLPNGDMVLERPRPFTTGLPKGFSDLFGWHTVEITPDMVGQRVAVFTAIEVKTETGRVSEQQQKFLDAVNKAGGRGFIARNVGDLSF